MSFIQQTLALLRVQRLRYRRDLSEHLRQFFFPIVIALGIFFFSKIDEGSDLIAIYLPWGYNGFVRNIFMDIVTDKKLKSREYFKINGLSRASYYTSHMILAALKGLLVGLILLIGVMAAGDGFVPAKDWILVYIVFELQAIANALFSFTVSVFFEDPYIGSDIVGTLFGIMGFFYFIGRATENRAVKIVCALLPPTAQTQGILGAALDDPDFSIADSIWMLFVDIAVLFLIFFICDTFYGIDKETTSKYWLRVLTCKKKKRSQAYEAMQDGAIIQTNVESSQRDQDSPDSSSATYHETFSNRQQLLKTVEVRDLKKNYNKIPVLKGVSVSMYERQIFCLLGHNGAGKTTSINILTGFTKASGGSVKYNGKDMKKFYNEIKKKIGVCPQTDLCYPFLSCEENLEIVAAIRGLSKDEIPIEIESQLKKVGLYEDRKKWAKQLSGGNRRKLSMAMALLGGTEILYFDEPTSAMDPASRRVIWQIIKDLRKDGKTIVLTTHYLEEADELADRIGVMSNGKLYAVGTPTYIKKQFGVGYRLFISPKYNHELANNFEALKPELRKITENVINGAILKDHTASDVLKFSLPFSEQPNFANLFEQLEAIKGVSLSLEMNSLEDAFLNITLQEEKKSSHAEAELVSVTSIPVSPTIPDVIKKEATYNFWAQLSACFKKRFLVTKRSPQGYFSVIQPIAFIITATILPNTIDQPERRIASFVAFIAVGFTANCSIYCGSTVYDREKRTKYMLRVMGCKNTSYWLGTYLFDFGVICCFVIFLIILISAQKIDFLVDDMGMFVGLTFGFVASLLTTAYLWGYVYSTAAAATSTFPVLALIVLYLGPMLLAAVFNYIEVTPVSQIFQAIGYIGGPWLPYQQALFLLNPDAQGSLFGIVLFDGVGWIVGILFIQAIVYMTLTLLIEYKLINLKGKQPDAKQNRPKSDEVTEAHDDVHDEMERLKNPKNKDPIKVLDLTKQYGNGHKALKGISFGVEKGQIFGLLGPNGAGKSTAFNIMTQLIDATSGEIYLNGKNTATTNKFDIYKSCGVCPQFDALWELLTVKEHLDLIGKVKGLTGADLKTNTDYFLEVLKIRGHKDKKTFQLSGGNKRRLCVALASTGAPKTQFMDEPSTGMDPLARTFLWDTIKQNLAAVKDSAIVLTTHSMTEAESLCSKIGILINGRFVCLGNTAYLKNKYGSGYKVTVSKGSKLHTEMIELIKQISVGAVRVEDESEIYETYQIPSAEFQFSVAFAKLEQFKKEEKIKDFSIYNTTLEQVFLEFSKHQISQKKDEAKPKKKRCLSRKAKSNRDI